jgi:hypothetical protein
MVVYMECLIFGDCPEVRFNPYLLRTNKLLLKLMGKELSFNSWASYIHLSNVQLKIALKSLLESLKSCLSVF